MGMVPALQGGYGTNDLPDRGAWTAVWGTVCPMGAGHRHHTALTAKRGKCEDDARAEVPADALQGAVGMSCSPVHPTGGWGSKKGVFKTQK